MARDGHSCAQIVHPEQAAGSIFTPGGVDVLAKSQEMAGQPIFMHAWHPSHRSVTTVYPGPRLFTGDSTHTLLVTTTETPRWAIAERNARRVAATS